MYKKTRTIVRAALIAAVYTAVALALAPLSFNSVQVRVSEALTMLPVLCPGAVAGVTIGCFFSNMATGSAVDMLLGTLTTLLAALATRRLRHMRLRGLPLAAALPPILFNAVIVGAMLTVLYFPPGSPIGVWAFNMFTVGVGQLISCGVLGVALVRGIESNPALLGFFTETANKNKN